MSCLSLTVYINLYCCNPYFFRSMDGCQPFFFFTPYPPFFHGVISHVLFYIPAAKASCCTANPHCPLIELLEIKKTKLTKSGEISSQYLCLYEAWRNSYPWLPLPGDMAVCMLEELARPWVGVYVPLACEQQTHFRSSLLSLRKISEGEKRRPEMRLLFAG